jgi:hypothetical protein
VYEKDQEENEEENKEARQGQYRQKEWVNSDGT